MIVDGVAGAFHGGLVALYNIAASQAQLPCYLKKGLKNGQLHDKVTYMYLTKGPVFQGITLKLTTGCHIEKNVNTAEYSPKW